MEGSGLVLLAGILGFLAAAKLSRIPRFRKFALGTLCSPVAGSLVFLIGSFSVADLNHLPVQEDPGFEAAAATYHPNAHQYWAWLGSTLLVSVIVFFVCCGFQWLFSKIAGSLNPP
jgi:hypothetical protein